MKIAICQPHMFDTIEKNLENVLQKIKTSADNNVDLAVFPECGSTGFHRNIPQQINNKIPDDAFDKTKTYSKEKNSRSYRQP